MFFLADTFSTLFSTQNVTKYMKWHVLEIVPQRCFTIKVFYKYAENLLKNIHAEV